MKNIIELIEYFDSERKASEYIAKQRWGNEVKCAHCNHDKVYHFKDGLRYKCKACSKHFTVRTGTIYQSSKISLKKWIIAAYLHISDKKGISSYQLARTLQVTQKTAWFMLSRLRHVYGFENDANQELEGVVEADETFVGGKNANRHKKKKFEKSMGRSFKDKTPILGMLQRGGKVRTVVIPNTNREYIQPVVEQVVKYGSILITDEWKAYFHMDHLYTRQVVNHGRGSYGDSVIHTNTIENFWNYIKRMIMGVYHNVTPKHLQKYANEATFRYNTRDMTDIERVAHVFTSPIGTMPYKKLVA